MKVNKKFYITLSKIRKANKYNRCKCGKYTKNTGNLNDKCPSVGLDYFLDGCGVIGWSVKHWGDSPDW